MQNCHPVLRFWRLHSSDR